MNAPMAAPRQPMVPGDELLRQWYRHQLFEQCKLPGSREGGLLMGVPIWGAAYIKRFARYCLPSLLADGNLGALGGCRMLLFSDRVGLSRLYELAQTLKLARVGIVPEFIEIPREVMEFMATFQQAKYLVLGTVQNLLPQIAARHGCHFHFLMCDHIYAPDYFPNLAKLGEQHHAIAQLCTSMLVTEGDEADRAIHAFRRGPTLSIPAQELTRLGWKYLHPQTRGAILTDAPNKMPQMHLVAWVAKDRLHMHCPHQNPAWLSAAACQLAPMVAPISLDAELPALMPGPFYVPKPEDGLACVEVSDASKPAVEQTWNFDQFAYNLWIQSNGEDRGMEFFEAGTQIDIGEGDPVDLTPPPAKGKRKAPKPLPRFSDAAIDQQLKDIVARLWAGQGMAGIRYMRQTARKVRIGL